MSWSAFPPRICSLAASSCNAHMFAKRNDGNLEANGFLSRSFPFADNSGLRTVAFRPGCQC